MDSKKAAGISAECLLEAECRMKEVGSRIDIGGIVRMYQDRLLFSSKSFATTGNRTIQILYEHIKETSKWLVFNKELNKCMMVLSVNNNNIEYSFDGRNHTDIKYGFDFRNRADKEKAEALIRGGRSVSS